MHHNLRTFLAALISLAMGSSFASGTTPATYLDDLDAVPAYQPQRFDDQRVRPLPLRQILDERRVELGRLLFEEKRLSGDDSISCASCHNLSTAGVDRLPTAVGIGGVRGVANTPTVFNASLNFVQFWDGRADSLETQVHGPLHSPRGMGSNWKTIIQKLRDTGYPELFEQAYGEVISPANIADALATFERSLLTPSRFDDYLRGDTGALTEQEREGFRLFREYGCSSCHQGVNIGGNLLHRLGGVREYFDPAQVRPVDLGRFNVTGRESDRHVFKVPSLRNVAVTQPYFHDGSVESLTEAVRIMGRVQLGRDLSDGDVDLLLQFLGSLTGRWHGRLLR